ncbi:hypothetical protein C0Q70_09041 [Pomacea canaliculata]|uniref:Homologous-pairing protein 2 homolog n=2 Tax=Pomacea canaliculata TaxID=400727 RepID=A0A2T7P8P2_POMCA|nr:hypothetical protein C0Q70_09041 [Pomacea canaliculata]
MAEEKAKQYMETQPLDTSMAYANNFSAHRPGITPAEATQIYDQWAAGGYEQDLNSSRYRGPAIAAKAVADFFPPSQRPMLVSSMWQLAAASWAKRCLRLQCHQRRDGRGHIPTAGLYELARIVKPACKAVLEYLIQQNRPYSAQDVFQNMGKDLGKTAVVRALETLAETKQIKEKIYGKQKVYVADQSQLPALNENEIKAMDQQITQLTGQLQQSQVETQRLEGELQNYKSLLSTEEAKAELQKTIRDVEQLTAKIQQLKEGRVLVSKEDREKVLKRRNHYVKEWRKRKRISMDIVGAVLEGYQKTKRQLLEEIGIETDEDHSVVPPDI